MFGSKDWFHQYTDARYGLLYYSQHGEMKKPG
jgi:hypothetical protein